MAAAVTERRVLAGSADLERLARTGEFVAAVSASAEHLTNIGRLTDLTERPRRLLLPP